MSKAQRNATAFISQSLSKPVPAEDFQFSGPDYLFGKEGQLVQPVLHGEDNARLYQEVLSAHLGLSSGDKEIGPPVTRLQKDVNRADRAFDKALRREARRIFKDPQFSAEEIGELRARQSEQEEQKLQALGRFDREGRSKLFGATLASFNPLKSADQLSKNDVRVQLAEQRAKIEGFHDAQIGQTTGRLDAIRQQIISELSERIAPQREALAGAQEALQLRQAEIDSTYQQVEALETIFDLTSGKLQGADFKSTGNVLAVNFNHENDEQDARLNNPYVQRFMNAYRPGRQTGIERHAEMTAEAG